MAADVTVSIVNHESREPVLASLRALLGEAGLRDVQVHPRYWVEGGALRRRELLARTPLRPYLAPQLILTSVKWE